MTVIAFHSIIEKFGKNEGEKSGWFYLLIPASQSEKLMPGRGKSFRVKGFIDRHPVSRLALLPDGEGNFILPLNQQIRKAISKNTGSKVSIKIEVDSSEYKLDDDLLACLEDDSEAKKYFFSLSSSHQNYFSKWIESAKTVSTKEKRLTLAIDALSKQMGYPEMLRAQKAKNNQAG